MALLNGISKTIHKIPRWLYGVIVTLLAAIAIISAGGGSILSKISIGDISNAYQTLVNFSPEIESISKSPWVGPTVIIILLLLVVFRIYKQSLLVIEHKSLAYDLAPLDSSVKTEYRIRKLPLDQVDLFVEGVPTSQSINQIRNVVSMAQKRKPAYLLGYYGIAHIPLIFRLGYLIGDQSPIILFHLNRAHNATFRELKQSEISTLTLSSEEENKGIESSEMLVAISISLSITREQINDFIGKEGNPMHILLLETNQKGFDVINNYATAEYIKNTILQEIQSRVQKYHLSKIHLLLSISSDFVFFLARSFSPQHDPSILVYHYEKGQYPWGIDMSAPDEDAIHKR